MIKTFLKYLTFGILWGCFWLIGVCVIMDIANIYALQYIFENFSIHALGSILVGIGFATSSVVYKIDRLRLGLQLTIHATIGLASYFAVAFSLGWLPSESPASIAFSLMLGVLTFFIIWCGFYLHGKNEEKKINAGIKKHNSIS